MTQAKTPFTQLQRYRAYLVSLPATEICDPSSELDYQCFIVQDGKVVKGTVRDFTHLFPQVQRTINITAMPEGQPDPELVLRQRSTGKREELRYEIVYRTEDADTVLLSSREREVLRRIYDNMLFAGILRNGHTEVYWEEPRAQAELDTPATT